MISKFFVHSLWPCPTACGYLISMSLSLSPLVCVAHTPGTKQTLAGLDLSWHPQAVTLTTETACQVQFGQAFLMLARLGWGRWCLFVRSVVVGALVVRS